MNHTVPRPVYNVPSTAVAGRGPGGGSNLTPGGSHEVVQQLNSHRAEMGGINKRPIPPGHVTVEHNGHVTVEASRDRHFDVRPDGRVAAFRRPGEEVRFRGNGHIAVLHTREFDINHGPHGERMIVSRRPGGVVVVSAGRHFGYVERPVMFHGNTYLRREYTRGPFGHSAVFVGYHYHGLEMHHYVPHYTYPAAFYGWAYYPWNRPVPYAWGVERQPWAGYYRGFYEPAPAYASGAAWLADYYLNQTLANGYEEEQGADAGDGGGEEAADFGDGQGGDDLYAEADAPITPEIQQTLGVQVQQQLAYENAAAGSAQPDQSSDTTDLPQVLKLGHMFVVDQPLSVETADGQTCALTAGNVLQLSAAVDPNAATATMTVLSTRKASCPAWTQVQVGLEALEEMQNNFRAQLDAGLHTMHDQQGQGGLPGAPDSAIGPPPRPGPDLPGGSENVDAMLQAQQKQASQTEMAMTQSAFANQP